MSSNIRETWVYILTWAFASCKNLAKLLYFLSLLSLG